MKYGQHLKDNIAPEYGPEPYLNYDKLKHIIRCLSEKAPASVDLTKRQVSLTIAPPTNARGIALSSFHTSEESFTKAMDIEMQKVESFTLTKVTELRQQLSAVETKLGKLPKEEITKSTDEIAEAFLVLEKYVNINFMGFHKILKKHDKYVPSIPCKIFYVTRLHSQAWVRGDYSDLVVRLSSIYSTLRNDQAAAESADASQSFLRQTSKYWVKTEDVSRVKYAILRHLPVFLQKTATGETDSQLSNSVYLDNDLLELYHVRLDKMPGAIALRLRWYGAGDPKLVFVERKTHRDKWTGDRSVKERFVIDESEVQRVMTNTYDIKGNKKKMLESGKSQKEADEWETLVTEITQAIVSKQLVPTMRTQYMRTAFQIPFDATVRISLDTNLCMISERGYNLQNMKVWHRDSSEILAKSEITRFPHAILEIKIELKGDNVSAPKWVTELQNSGMLYEVHKFSKFIHGCAVLLPEYLRSVPYWIDDVSVRDSIIASGAERILAEEKDGVGPGANQVYNHLLPFGDTRQGLKDTAVGRTGNSIAASQGFFGANAAIRKKKGVNFYSEENMDDSLALTFWTDEDGGCFAADTCMGWMFPFCSRDHAFYEAVLAPTRFQKVEPKLFFANERTFLHWLHNGVILATFASGILAFSNDTGEEWAHWYALVLLPLSLAFCIYALHIFLWRADRIKTRIPGRWDDPRGPLLLGGALALVMIVSFCAKLHHIFTYGTLSSLHTSTQ